MNVHRKASTVGKFGRGNMAGGIEEASARTITYQNAALAVKFSKLGADVYKHEIPDGVIFGDMLHVLVATVMQCAFGSCIKFSWKNIKIFVLKNTKIE